MGNFNNKYIYNFSKNIYIKFYPKYYQYDNYDNYLDNKDKYLIQYKNKSDIISFMKKQFKVKDNYLFNYNDYNDFLIKNIKIENKI